MCNKIYSVVVVFDHRLIFMVGDKNIISLSAAEIGAFLFYGIKFLSKPNDKNFIPFPILTRTL
jgi:hypothetical protein